MADKIYNTIEKGNEYEMLGLFETSLKTKQHVL